VKEINAVQDESAKKLPPQHIMGSGLRKSPPELNAAAVSTGGGAASAVTGPAGAAAATVNTSSRRSGHNTIAVSDAAAAAASNTSSALNPGGSINATSSGHSQPTANSSVHSQPSVNTGRNLDIHDASSFPVPAITAQDNISVYSSSEDDSSVFVISAKKTTSKIKDKFRSLQRGTGGAAKKNSQSSPGQLTAATSLVNLTGGCLETEGKGANVLPAVVNVLPAIDEVINEMFPPLRESVADDIEVVGLARKETPLFDVEGVAAARAPFGSSDMFSDSGEDEHNSGTKHSGNKVGGAMSTNMEAQMILGRFRSKQASLTSPSLFAKTTDKGSYFSSSDEENDEENDIYPEEDPTERLYEDDELFQDDKEEDLNDLSYFRSDAKSCVGRKLYRRTSQA